MSEIEQLRSRDNSAGNRTRDELIAVAASLFAENGVDAVSLAEINRVAGQRNNSAVTYHFGSKAGLIEAIHDFHTVKGGVRRGPLIAALEEQENPDMREIVAVAIVPVALKLLHDDGGGDFIIMLASLLNGTEWQENQARYHARWERWRTLANRVSPPMDESHERARSQSLMLLVIHSFADWERRRRAGLQVSDIEVLVDTLVEAATAVYESPRPTRRYLLELGSGSKTVDLSGVHAEATSGNRPKTSGNGSQPESDLVRNS